MWNKIIVMGSLGNHSPHSTWWSPSLHGNADLHRDIFIWRTAELETTVLAFTEAYTIPSLSLFLFSPLVLFLNPLASFLLLSSICIVPLKCQVDTKYWISIATHWLFFVTVGDSRKAVLKKLILMDLLASTALSINCPCLYMTPSFWTIVQILGS